MVPGSPIGLSKTVRTIRERVFRSLIALESMLQHLLNVGLRPLAGARLLYGSHEAPQGSDKRANHEARPRAGGRLGNSALRIPLGDPERRRP